MIMIYNTNLILIDKIVHWMDDWLTLIEDCHSCTENTVDCSDVQGSEEAVSGGGQPSTPPAMY